jgi:hypothetical protein
MRALARHLPRRAGRSGRRRRAVRRAAWPRGAPAAAARTARRRRGLPSGAPRRPPIPHCNPAMLNTRPPFAPGAWGYQRVRENVGVVRAQRTEGNEVAHATRPAPGYCGGGMPGRGPGNGGGAMPGGGPPGGIIGGGMPGRGGKPIGGAKPIGGGPGMVEGGRREAGGGRERRLWAWWAVEGTVCGSQGLGECRGRYSKTGARFLPCRSPESTP